MKLSIYAIRDNKTASFAAPMFEPTDGSMLRNMSDAVNNTDPKNPLYHHSEDFELFRLGTYDTDTATIESHAPTAITTATQLKRN